MIGNRLKKGDAIGIVAPSKALDEEHKKQLEDFKKYAEGELGLKIVEGKHIFEVDKFGHAAGSGEQRAADINEMFADESVDAIWCFQGGSPANQTLDFLDYDLIKNNPKVFMGMSDVDVLLLTLNQKTGLITFNTPDAKRGRNLDMDLEYSFKSFIFRMFEGSKEIVADSEWKTVRGGSAAGKSMGCNLNCILKLAGTKYFPDFADSILFLEAYKTNVKDTQCKLEQLKQVGVFDKIKGIVIGYVYGFQDEEQRKENESDVDYEEIVLEATKDYDFPILKINEFGHRCKNMFLPIGCDVKMDADKKEIKIVSEFVK